MKKLLIPALLALSSTAALADSYNFDAGISFVDREIGDGYSDAFVFEGAYYFGGVDDSKGPLAEAPFIDRASSLSVVYGVGETFPYDEDITTTGIGGRYVGKDSGLIIDVNYLSNQIADRFFEESKDSTSIEVGMYIDDLSTLTIGVTNNRITETNGFDEDANNISISYKQLIELAGDSSVNVEATIGTTDFEESDDLVEGLIGVDYYFSRTFSLGVVAGYASVRADEGAARYGINAKYFFNDSVYMYGETDLLEADEDEIYSYRLGVQMRF